MTHPLNVARHLFHSINIGKIAFAGIPGSGNHFDMPRHILLWISVALNLIFLLAWSLGGRILPAPISPSPSVPDIDLIARSNRIQTKVVMRRQNFTWEEVESDNYLTYVKNLREIGCPESTIRDIIVADVDELYAHRRMTEVVSADHQWWRSEPDIEAVQKAQEKLKSLETERANLLTRLLGPNWDTSSNPLPPATRTGITLTGPILGEMSPQAKQAVYDIAVNTQQKIDAYQEAQKQAGKEIDPAELTRLRAESRSELAKVLTPPQMEEFLLRYSQTAFQMRADLRGVELTPDEFRNLFHARDPIEQQPDMHYNGDDPVELKHKQDLEAQRDAAMQQTLGKERYAAYKLYHDPVFKQSQVTAEQYGAPPALVMPIYQINQLSEAERQRIRGDTTLTDDEKIDALAATQAEQEKSLQKILAPDILQRYKATNSPPQ
jgi:hypothetical protein